MGDRVRFEPRFELFSGLAALYQSRDWSDLVLFSRDGSRHTVHRAIVCPRSAYLYLAVKERKWRDNVEGHLALPDDEEIVKLLVEYFYLLDYDPAVTISEDAASSHGDSSDGMSVRTEAGQYGHVYGTSAVSAFGGPMNPYGTFSTVPSRPRAESSLTVHALPSAAADFAQFAPGPLGPRRRKPTRGSSMVVAPPDPSPLATKEPHLVLHAKMYAAGERYNVEGLKALALEKFKIQLTRHWDSPELAECIHVVYDSTPASEKDMREAVADTLGWHGELLEKPEIEVAIMDINGLAYELLKRSRRAEPDYD